MKSLGIAYAGTLVSFLIVDAIWLGLVARSFYREQLSDLLLPSPNFIIAAMFYLFLAITVVVLAILPGLETGSAWTAIGYGALLGLAAYCTYDITNLSALRGWPVALSVVDIA